MPDRFLVAISATDQYAAQARLQQAIDDAEYDDCGILDNVHCIVTTDSFAQVFEQLRIRVADTDQLVVAPLGNGVWAAHNAPAMEDCGRIAGLRRRRKQKSILPEPEELIS
jgi:hypothetical protein